VAYLILTDIHGNREALEAVLADAEGLYDCVLCLGDLVGYGADPNAVSEWAREETAATVRGNHDRACAGTESLEFFNPAARTSAIWSRRALIEENRNYLNQLPRGPLRIEEPLGAFLLVHGSPIDEDQYVSSMDDAALMEGHLELPVTFFGHTHLQGAFRLAPAGVARIRPPQPLRMEQGYQYLINPGSVGQPRDGDPRAAYVLYSIEDQTVEFRRVAYDIDGAAAKIRAAGLPEVLARRLYDGM
jgi:diadenosine tetraphosphatase ApaH/serine/threonine PP2A family protein phosphatase